MGGKIKINCSLNKIILPINPSLKLLPFFPPPPFLPFPPSSSSPSCPRSRFVRLRTCDSVGGCARKSCVLLRTFRRRAATYLDSSFVICACGFSLSLASTCPSQGRQGVRGFGACDLRFCAWQSPDYSVRCIRINSWRRSLGRCFVMGGWVEEDGWRNTFVLRILYQRLGRAYKKEPEPSGIRDSPGCFRRFLSAENLRCRDGDGGWKEQGVRELWEHSYLCKSVVEYAYRLLIIFCPSTILTPVPLCRDGRPLRS